MAYVITDRCTQCGECLDVCPIGSISVGDPKYVIDDTCCDFGECVVVCPEEAIIPLDDLIEELNN
jgi:ferredoxin